MTLTPGCYIDSRHGHYAIPGLIEFAHGHGFPYGRFVEFTVAQYADHYMDDNYPTGDLDDLANMAEAWLNDNHKYEGHAWYWNDGDFGLYPIEEDN